MLEEWQCHSIDAEHVATTRKHRRKIRDRNKGKIDMSAIFFTCPKKSCIDQRRTTSFAKQAHYILFIVSNTQYQISVRARVYKN